MDNNEIKVDEQLVDSLVEDLRKTESPLTSRPNMITDQFKESDINLRDNARINIIEQKVDKIYDLLKHIFGESVLYNGEFKDFTQQ